MKNIDLRTYIIEVTNFDGELIGSFQKSGMSMNNTFVDFLIYTYDSIKDNSVEHHKEDEDFEVSVYKFDTLGRKRLVGEMDVCCEGDSTFEEVIELAYHGCTDN